MTEHKFHQMRKAILIMLLLFGMNAVANTEPDPKAENQFYYLKKAKYFEIKAKLEANKITTKEAQALWNKAIAKIRKKEEKQIKYA
jgi:predicted secreted Zn-dependent protease